MQNQKLEPRNPQHTRVSFRLQIWAFGFLIAIGWPLRSASAQSTSLTYQGRITAYGTNFTGNGQFKFALVTSTNADTNVLYTTFWSNDGTSVAGSEPATALVIGVTNGLFTAVLGDIAQPGMAALDASLFAQTNLQLRIWFNDGASGFAALDPPQNLTPAPYAISANVAVKLLNGLMVQSNTNGAPNVIGGASVNNVSSNVIGATIAGGGASNYNGDPITNSVTGDFGTVGGGFLNTAAASATVAGGSFNTASAYRATVGGGYDNTVTNQDATVGGGQYNLAGGTSSTVGGGFQNHAIGDSSTVSGGGNNLASGYSATVSGGLDNSATQWYASVVGGSGNIASGNYSTVAGGLDNTASGTSAIAAGGFENLAAGDWSFAAGHRAKANHYGSFVWADSQIPDFTSSTYDEFSVRAQGGARFFTGGAGLKLGSTAQYYATGGKESLRIIRGVVDATGTAIHGSDFSVTRTGTGAYTITFTSPFTSFPAVTVSAQSGVARMATTTNVSITGAQIRTFDATGAAVDAQFAFIAVGLQ